MFKDFHFRGSFRAAFSFLATSVNGYSGKLVSEREREREGKLIRKHGKLFLVNLRLLNSLCWLTKRVIKWIHWMLNPMKYERGRVIFIP